MEVFEVEAVTTDCMVGLSFTCAQITIYTVNISCDEPGWDLSGDYSLGFEAKCRNVTEKDKYACKAFLEDNNGPNIALNVSATIIANVCPPDLYIFQATIGFIEDIEFYDDFAFSQLHSSADPQDAYIIGQDTIYVQVEVNFPDDGSGDNYDIFGIIVDNAFVCTAPRNVTLSVTSDETDGEIGCLSSKIDTDGLFNIILNGQANEEYFAEIISSQIANQSSNIVQFSFLAFDVFRTTIYVHVQLTLVLKNGQRRRLQDIVSTNNGAQDRSSQIRHFMGSVGVNSVPELEFKTTEININVQNEYDLWYYLQVVIIVIGLVFAVMIVSFVCYIKLKEFSAKSEEIAKVIVNTSTTSSSTSSV